MISQIVKIKVSDFVYNILHNDAEKFEFINYKNEPNLNGLLNKLIPNLLDYRKLRRAETHRVLENEFMHKDADKIYESVNTIIDRVYFSDAVLGDLEENIWFRPSVKNIAVFNEIADSETIITAQSTSTYIRSLLNEYACLPEYKREQLLFNYEMYCSIQACETGRLLHANLGGKSIQIFAFDYVYEYTYKQSNLLIGYDLTNKIIGAIPLYKIKAPYLVERKYKPSENLINMLQKYYEDVEYDTITKYEVDV